MKYQVDRNIAIPISQQIQGQIAHAISTGLLEPGDRLPTLRELASMLGVSYASVSNVYQELAEHGLLITRPRRGTFVADLAGFEGINGYWISQTNLEQLVDTLVRQALFLGHSGAEILGAVARQLQGLRDGATVRHVVCAGSAKRSVESYAAEIENLLKDLKVKVHPVLIRELNCDVDKALEGLPDIKLVITVPTALHELRSLLEPKGLHVAAVAFQVSFHTRQRLASIPPGTRLGVVATEPEYIPPLLQGVSSYVSPNTAIQHAVRNDEDRLKCMLSSIDVMVYHSGCEEVLRFLPHQVEAIEYLHSPEPDSVLRLRPLIV
jgi:DNA-binding transcriptional regulator YhcF (GntR family)